MPTYQPTRDEKPSYTTTSPNPTTNINSILNPTVHVYTNPNLSTPISSNYVDSVKFTNIVPQNSNAYDSSPIYPNSDNGNNGNEIKDINLNNYSNHLYPNIPNTPSNISKKNQNIVNSYEETINLKCSDHLNFENQQNNFDNMPKRKSSLFRIKFQKNPYFLILGILLFIGGVVLLHFSLHSTESIILSHIKRCEGARNTYDEVKKNCNTSSTIWISRIVMIVSLIVLGIFDLILAALLCLSSCIIFTKALKSYKKSSTPPILSQNEIIIQQSNNVPYFNSNPFTQSQNMYPPFPNPNPNPNPNLNLNLIHNPNTNPNSFLPPQVQMHGQNQNSNNSSSISSTSNAKIFSILAIIFSFILLLTTIAVIVYYIYFCIESVRFVFFVNDRDDRAIGFSIVLIAFVVTSFFTYALGPGLFVCSGYWLILTGWTFFISLFSIFGNASNAWTIFRFILMSFTLILTSIFSICLFILFQFKLALLFFILHFIFFGCCLYCVLLICIGDVAKFIKWIIDKKEHPTLPNNDINVQMNDY